MLTKLEQIQSDALTAIANVSDETTLEEARVGFLGKKSPLTAAAGGMRDVANEDKKAVGQNSMKFARPSPLLWRRKMQASPLHGMPPRLHQSTQPYRADHYRKEDFIL